MIPVERARAEEGYALVTVLLLLGLVMALLGSYFTVTVIDLASAQSSMRTVRGLYAAEAGLNVRWGTVRGLVEANGTLGGVAPDTGSGQTPCATGNLGSGDLACVDYTLNARTVSTWVEPAAPAPVATVVPRGQRFQNRSADEQRYAIGAISNGRDGRAEARLQMSVERIEVPLFQFAAFYDKDLEIRPESSRTWSGPIHTGGDLYLDPDSMLKVKGQVTSVGQAFRGAKHQDACRNGTVNVLDPDDLASLPACAGSRAQLAQTTLDAWNGMIRTSMEAIVVPSVQMLDATPGQPYWDRADFRIVLDLNPPGPAVEVRNAGGSKDSGATTTLGGCSAASHSNTLYNQREAAYIEMLDVDLVALLDCLHLNGLLGAGKDLDDASDGGLVLYLGVDGPSSNVVNNYGVRLLNGAELASAEITAPALVGLTVATDQALYVQGDYNAVNKKPAALLADSFNVLSGAWSDANSSLALPNRVATGTTLNAAVLSGTDTTGGVEGAGGRDLGGYNGGLGNQARLHEEWNGAPFTFRGSWVSLDAPRHVAGAWAYGAPYYDRPTRDFDYDTGFDDATALPPLTPRFSYVTQGLQLHRFEL